MDTAKLFIALSIEKNYIKDILGNFSSLDLPWEKIRKVEGSSIHLTLKFLGPTTIDKIPTIIDSLEKVQLKTHELLLRIEKTEIFNGKNPRVLSLALEKNELLQNLYQQIDQNIFNANISNMEIRQFKPHLTLARVKQAAEVEEFSPYLEWKPKKEFIFSHFELIESVATKNGPIYSNLQSFEL